MGLEEREKTAVSFIACTAVLVPSQPSRLAEISTLSSSDGYVHYYAHNSFPLRIAVKLG